MNLENIQNLSTDLLELLKDYNRLKELESRSFDLQITEAQKEKIKELHFVGHRNLYRGILCSGKLAVILPLSLVTGDIHRPSNEMIALYCSDCAQIIHLDKEGNEV